MKLIRYTIAVLYGAVTASAWWASFVFNIHSSSKSPTALIPVAAVLMTVLGTVLAGKYCAEHWNEE